MSYYMGVDPGKSGAIVVITEKGQLVDAIKLTDTEQEISRFVGLAGQQENIKAILEFVRSMPRQGVASSFKFGVSYGFLRGLLTAHSIPFEEVTPSKWQGALGCRTKGNKNITKQKAGELFPSHKWTHATADAVLLAEYGRRLEMRVSK